MTKRLIEIIKMYKRAPVSDEPKTTMPEQRQQRVTALGSNFWTLML